MQRDDIEAKVVSVLSTMLRQPVDADATRETLAQWDSLRHIEIVFTLEEELGIQFLEAELAELNSVARIVDAVLACHET